jgi:hypothetical protein
MLRAQTQTPPMALPAEAQKAFSSGQAATRQKRWDTAIEYFAKGQQSAKTNPQVLLNLGMTHGKAGHDLAGIVWLHAYLAAVPGAADTAAVRQEIARLELANQARMAGVIQQAVNRAMKTEDTIKRKWLLGVICTTEAASGNIAGALKLLPSFQALGGTLRNSDLWKQYLVSKAQAGHVQFALGWLGHVRPEAEGPPTEDDNRLAVLLEVYRFQKDAGDWEGARATVAAMPKAGVDEPTRNRFLAQINKSREEFESHQQDLLRQGCCGSNLPLTEWVLQANNYASYQSPCGTDLDLTTAVQHAVAPSVEADQAADNLEDIANTLANCSNAIQALQTKLAWQAQHRRAQ